MKSRWDPPLQGLAALVAVGTVLLLTLACAKPESGALFEGPSRPAAGHARLYVYRVDEVRSSGVASVRLAGEVVGRLANQQYLTLDLEPGQQLLSVRFRDLLWSLDWGEVPVRAVAGQTHFLRLRAEPMQRTRRAGALEDRDAGPRNEDFTIHLSRTLLPAEQALPEIRGTRRAE